ncbi:pilus assembly protein [Bordetella holmesii]|nr:pilus assembly protein [Bordetella holmesii H558]AOB36685.1 pilus assembly protein [Bordetella holmesii]KAK85650.1 hypothetical protein L503_2392 [Bordetella holmesii CDC-H809-BH]KCV14769.1 hypothetical protein L500_1737 [Bordetella holmesii CDC-H643-BH]KCV15190.1 hypothetical protein AZ25_1682 [Bordetella holmesii 04P3421]
MPTAGVRGRRAHGCRHCACGPRLLHGYSGRSVAAELIQGPGGDGMPWTDVLMAKVLRGDLDPRHWAVQAGGVRALAAALEAARA